MTWIITPDKFLKDKEVKQLVKVCSDAAILADMKGNWLAIRDWMIIDLALNTGLRVKEISDLKVEDLHLDYKQSSIEVKNGKGGKRRVVRIGAKLKTHLKKYLTKTSLNSAYLFASCRGDKLTRSAIQKIFKKYAKAAGLPPHLSIHSCRHYYGTKLYKSSNNNLRLVQKQLGHSSVVTTQVYADVMDEDVEKALLKLEE